MRKQRLTDKQINRYMATIKDALRIAESLKGGGRSKRRKQRRSLTSEQVKDIYFLKGQTTAAVVATKYGVHQTTVSAIWRGVSWSNVTGASKRE